jgi:hypothetical protein
LEKPEGEELATEAHFHGRRITGESRLKDLSCKKIFISLHMGCSEADTLSERRNGISYGHR